MYSSTLSLTSVLGGVGWLMPSPSFFTSRKGTQYPLYGMLNGSHGQSGWVPKFLPHPPPGFDTQTACPVVSRYTNYTIPAHQSQMFPPTLFPLDNELENKLTLRPI